MEADSVASAELAIVLTIVVANVVAVEQVVVLVVD